MGQDCQGPIIYQFLASLFLHFMHFIAFLTSESNIFSLFRYLFLRDIHFLFFCANISIYSSKCSFILMMLDFVTDLDLSVRPEHYTARPGCVWFVPVFSVTAGAHYLIAVLMHPLINCYSTVRNVNLLGYGIAKTGPGRILPLLI